MIIVTGDIHGDFGSLNAMVNKQKPQIVLNVGDFGYWPHMPAKKFYGPTCKKNAKLPAPRVGRTKVYWCDGNHEDHHSLIARHTDELWPNVYYQPRGSTLKLPDGRTVLFMGGADSYDKRYRTEGVDWFPEELITQADLDRLPVCKVDIVVSHTCPCEFVMGLGMDFDLRLNDPCRHALSVVLHKYQPALWYFGHWHKNVTCYDEAWKCRWTALGHTFGCGSGRWWEELRE